MRDTGLADRIRAKGVTVVEVAGWTTRGNDGNGFSVFRPRGSGNHHTAGSSSGTTPSLSTCIYGRPDVGGPLCQVLQSREADPSKDKAYVIAAGKANHGGVGTWTGDSGTMDSNYESEGLEIEHIGTTTVPAARLEIAARIQAAMLEAPGSSRDASMCWQHFEYAKPDGRKIDFAKLYPLNADSFRERVAFWIGRTQTQGEWLDMVSKTEFDNAFEGVAPAGIRIAEKGVASPAKVYYSDLQSYIFECKNGGRYDALRKALLTMQGRSTTAQRFEKALLDEMMAVFPDAKRLP
jgi:hypothetical protein